MPALRLAPAAARTAAAPVRVDSGASSWRVRILRPPDMDEIHDIPALEDAEEPRTFDEKGEVIGNGIDTFQFSVYEQDGWDIQHHDIVQFIDRGTVISAGVIRASQTEIHSLEGRQRRVTTWTGSGLHDLLNEALIWPSQGPGVTPVEEDRVFNWTSPDFDISAWAPVNEIELFEDARGNPAGSGTWPSQPMGDGFPEVGAYMIGPPGATTGVAPPGWIYVAKDVTVPVGGSHRVYLITDNLGTLYIDSVPVINVNPNDGFRRASSVLLDLSAGPHRIAISCWNAPDDGAPGGNPIGIGFALAKADQGGFFADLVDVSDGSWVGVFYPPRPPGMTPGEAMLICLDEAQNEYDSLTWITPSFTADVDSNGLPWPEYGDLACKAGRTTMWKFTEQLIGSKYLDSRISLNGQRWDLFAYGTLGQLSGVTYDVEPADVEFGNLQRWTTTSTGRRADLILTKSRFGWSAHGGGPAGRVIQGVLGLGTLQSESEVERWSDAQVDDFSSPIVQEDIDVAPLSEADTPLVGFRCLDYVNLGASLYPMASCVWSRDKDTGRIKYKPKLGSRLQTKEERKQRLFESMVPGTFNGESKIATPLDQIAYQSVADCCNTMPYLDPG